MLYRERINNGADKMNKEMIMEDEFEDEMTLEDLRLIREFFDNEILGLNIYRDLLDYMATEDEKYLLENNRENYVR